jgi:hypothetical protein
MTLPSADDIETVAGWALRAVGIAFLLWLCVHAFLNRNMPRLGGKVGRRRTGAAPVPVPQGFSRVDCREITHFAAPADAAAYPNLKTYMRDGPVRQPGLVHVYRVAGCKTCIEIPAAAPEYDRIDASEALALLREVPDPRLVLRLHLSDTPSFMDPWTRRLLGREDVFHLGNAMETGLIVLYLPDRGFGRQLANTMMHEWLHLVAFKTWWTIMRFERANKIEALPPLPFEPVASRGPKAQAYEEWARLGEKLLGDDETVARQAALAAPVHAMILWRRVEKIMRKVPKRLASTRLAEFRARAAFMRAQVKPQARAARRRKSACRPRPGASK